MSLLRRLLANAERVALPVVVLALVVIFSVHPMTSSSFTSVSNVRTVLLTQSVIAVAAIAVTIPLIANQFDVSVGPTLGMSSMLAGGLMASGLPTALSVAVAVFAGALIGAVNGYIVGYLGNNSFIITLGSGTLVTGLVSLFSDDRIVTSIPSAYVNLGTGLLAGLPRLSLLFLVVAVAVGAMLRYSVFGRRLALVGANPEAAQLVGIRVPRTIFVGFVQAGALAGVAGVMLLAQTGAANPQVGAGYTLPALAAAFLGATTLRPGHFNITGTVIGVFFVAVAVNGLVLAGAAGWVQPVFNGAALVLAVTLSSALARLVRS